MTSHPVPAVMPAPQAGAHPLSHPDRTFNDTRSARLLRELRDLSAAQRRNTPARQALIVMHLPLVERLAGRYAGRGVPRDDLVQVGAIGLLHAVDRFDATRSVPFAAFATLTVTGEIQRYLRDRAALMRGPRPKVTPASATTAPVPARACAAGRSPAVPDRPAGPRVSLLGDWDAPGGPFALSVQLSVPDEKLSAVEDRQLLWPLLRALPLRDRHIIYGRFFQDLTLAQIAAVLGLSVSRVSRLLSRALDSLRESLQVVDAPARELTPRSCRAV